MKTKLTTKDLSIIPIFTAIIIIGTYIRLPFPVIPMTLQVFAVLLSGQILGSKNGALSVVVYIALGLLGVPVFSSGGGLTSLVSPTFGYIVGFVPTSYIAGFGRDKLAERNFKKLFLINVLAIIPCYLCGMVWLYVIKNFYLNTPINIYSVLYFGFLKTILTDLIHCALTAFISLKTAPKLKQLGYLK